MCSTQELVCHSSVQYKVVGGSNESQDVQHARSGKTAHCSTQGYRVPSSAVMAVTRVISIDILAVENQNIFCLVLEEQMLRQSPK